MSGEAKNKKHYGKGKGGKGAMKGLEKEENKTNGVSNGRKKDKQEAAAGASLLTKLIFGVLLISFTLVASVYLVDYKQGQLAKLTASLPPEVQQVAAKGDFLLGQMADNVKTNLVALKNKVEELSKQVFMEQAVGALGAALETKAASLSPFFLT